MSIAVAASRTLDGSALAFGLGFRHSTGGAEVWYQPDAPTSRSASTPVSRGGRRDGNAAGKAVGAAPSARLRQGRAFAFRQTTTTQGSSTPRRTAPPTTRWAATIRDHFAHADSDLFLTDIFAAQRHDGKILLVYRSRRVKHLARQETVTTATINRRSWA